MSYINKILSPNSTFPVVFHTFNRESATITGFVQLKDGGRFIGVIHAEANPFCDERDIPALWDSEGHRINQFGSIAKVQDDDLDCPQLPWSNKQIRDKFSALLKDEKEILFSVYQATRTRKINGIKAIRKLTGWGLTESKYLFEHVLPKY